jgi:hypothetical protein
MKKIFVSFTILMTSLFSENTALFATVNNVAKNDTLNVRTEANYKSEKVGEIPPEWHIGVTRCKKVNNATWCKVYPLIQVWADKFGDKDTGWVNAKYLKFYNKGYVTVSGKTNDCYYSMECKNSVCHVVVEMQYDYEKKDMIEWKTEWIDRSKLNGESNFGAIDSSSEGYCTNAPIIEAYLKKLRRVKSGK